MTPPPNTAILLIDPYNDFLHPRGKLTHRLSTSLATTSSIAHLTHLVTFAHAHRIPIFYGLHQQVKPGFLQSWTHPADSQTAIANSGAFTKGSWGAEIYEGLEPKVEEGDVVVSKHWCSSSFENTDLRYQLMQRGVDRVVLAGMIANTCLEMTGRMAYEL
jgi:nicotinamidase-related amidase